MCAVEQCVWQCSLCPVTGLRMLPSWSAQSVQRCFLWMTGRHFVMHTIAHFLIPSAVLVVQSVQFLLLVKTGPESQWLKGPRLLVALRRGILQWTGTCPPVWYFACLCSVLTEIFLCPFNRVALRNLTWTEMLASERKKNEKSKTATRGQRKETDFVSTSFFVLLTRFGPSVLHT